MVGPVSAADRAAFARKVQLGLAGLVGVSAGLSALRVGASLPVTGGAVLAGTAVGWVLARFVVPAGESLAGEQRRRDHQRENPFDDSAPDPDGEDPDSARTADRRRNS